MTEDTSRRELLLTWVGLNSFLRYRFVNSKAGEWRVCDMYLSNAAKSTEYPGVTIDKFVKKE